MAWLSGWKKRIKLTSDSTKIDADLTHFPMTVFLKPGNGNTAKVFDEVGGNKYKIAITDDSDPPIQYYVEIEHWDATNKVGVLHFGKAGEILPSTANKVFYLYYDNTKPDNTTYVGDIGSTPAQNVWDSYFKNVFHLRDLTTSTVKDSTINAITGYKKEANEPIEIDGKVGKAQNFDGVNDYIDVNDITYPGVPFTIEAVFKINSKTSAEMIFNDRNPANSGSNVAVQYGTGTDTFICWANAGESGVWSRTYPAVNTWYHIAFVVPFSSGVGSRLIYFNGVDDTDYKGSLAAAPWNPSKSLGRRPVGNTYFWNGSIDEFRISNTNRSSAWIKATYHSLFDSLLIYGAEEIQIQKYFLIQEASIINLQKQTSLIKAIVEQNLISLFKGLFRTFQVIEQSIISFSFSKVFIKIFQIIEQSLISLSKKINYTKLFAITETSLISFSKKIAKFFSIIEQDIVSFAKLKEKVFQIVEQNIVSLKKGIQKFFLIVEKSIVKLRDLYSYLFKKQGDSYTNKYS